MAGRLFKVGWAPALAGLVLAAGPARASTNSQSGSLGTGVAGIVEQVAEAMQEAKQDELARDRFRHALRKALAVMKQDIKTDLKQVVRAAVAANGKGQAQQNAKGKGNGNNGEGQQAKGQQAQAGGKQQSGKQKQAKRGQPHAGGGTSQDLASAGLPGGRAGSGSPKAQLGKMLAAASMRQDRNGLFGDMAGLVKDLAKRGQDLGKSGGKAAVKQDLRHIAHALKDIHQDKQDLRHDRTAQVAKKVKKAVTHVAQNKGTGNSGSAHAGSKGSPTARQASHGTGHSAVANGMHNMQHAFAQHMAMMHQQAMAHSAMQAHMASQMRGGHSGGFQGRRR